MMNFKITLRRIGQVILLLCLSASAIYANAQSTTEGAIAGIVTDPSGAAIPNAVIVLHNDGTNAEIKVIADAAGYYKAPLVSPGIYTVKITATNFGTYTATTVAVTVGSLTEVNAALRAGTAVESVSVTSESPLIKLESADISETLTAKEIVDLPLNGGRWSNLALLTPGAVADSNGFGLISFRGISPLLNTVEIDGADDNQAFFSEERGRTREGYSTSQIAIAEFQVNTGVYSAEYGRAAGGVLNAITKSGTNKIHGQAYFDDRDNDWGALNPFTTLTSVVLPTGGGTPSTPTNPYGPKDWRKRWGFGMGGPIIHDKLFWFYAYDQYSRNFPGVAKASSPTPFFGQWADLTLPATISECEQYTPSGSSTTYGVALPATSTSTPVTIGDQNACALAWRIYGGNYATAAAHYDQLLYGTAVSSVTGLSGPGILDDLGIAPRTGSEVLNTPKLDWQITPKEHASFLAHRERWDSPGGVQTQTSNAYAIDSFGTDFVKLDYGLFKLDSLINASNSNEFRFQFGRELDDEGEQPFSSFTSTYLNNSTSTPVQVYIDGSNALNVLTGTNTPNPAANTSSTNYGITAGMPYYSFRKAYPKEYKTQLSDTANWTHKNHNIKYGIDYLNNADTINNLYESNGVYTYTYFSNLFADILNPAGTCDSGHHTEGGLVTSGKSYPCYYGFTQGFGSPEFDLKTEDYGLFIQDDWKFNSRLTFNLGLRYEYEHVPQPYPALIAAEVNPYPATTNHPNNVTNFGPRFGLSWAPFANDKTVVHAGAGFYYGRNLNGVILNAYEATGSKNGQFTIPSLYGKQVTSGVPAFPQVINATTSFPTPSIDYFAKGFRNPEVQQFDLSIQHETWKGIVVTGTYAGALGRELPNFLNLNLNTTTMYSSTVYIADNSGNVNGTVCGPLACGTAITSNVYSSNIESQYGTITEVISNINSNYNAMIIDVANHSNRYAQFDINYTWSHSLDYAQNESTSPSTNNWYDPYSNPKANYGNSSFNIPSRLVAWALLNYPGHSTGILKYFLNGWHLNPVYQQQDGLPYTAATSGYQPGSSLYSGINGSGSSSYLLQLGRNSFKQPSTYVLDMRLQKDMHINDRLNLELLGECFNTLNHQNVTAMNTTAYDFSGSKLEFQAPSGTGIHASGFGTVNNADNNFTYSQRQIQLGMKLDF
jgi:hypothetical protein